MLGLLQLLGAQEQQPVGLESTAATTTTVRHLPPSFHKLLGNDRLYVRQVQEPKSFNIWLETVRRRLAGAMEAAATSAPIMTSVSVAT